MTSFSDKLTDEQMREIAEWVVKLKWIWSTGLAILSAPEEQLNRRNCLMKLIALALTCVAIALVATACTETATPTNTQHDTHGCIARSACSISAARSISPLRAPTTQRTAKLPWPRRSRRTREGRKQADQSPSLKVDHAIKHTDEQLAKMITDGEEAMPAFKDKLSPQEIQDLVQLRPEGISGEIINESTLIRRLYHFAPKHLPSVPCTRSSVG